MNSSSLLLWFIFYFYFITLRYDCCYYFIKPLHCITLRICFNSELDDVGDGLTCKKAAVKMNDNNYCYCI